MQNNNLLKRTNYLGYFIIACLIMVTNASCNKSDIAPDLINFKGDLNAFNMVPPYGVNAPKSYGEVAATYNALTKKLNYTISWHSFSGGSGAVVNVVFYNAPIDFNGPEIFRLSDYPPGPHAVVEGDYIVPLDLEEELLKGNFYVIVSWWIEPSNVKKRTEARANFIVN